MEEENDDLGPVLGVIDDAVEELGSDPISLFMSAVAVTASDVGDVDEAEEDEKLLSPCNSREDRPVDGVILDACGDEP